MASPKPDHIEYEDLINNISKGEIQIPQFQRDFVWELEQSAKLLDSILKGYPIGTFIFWRTKERLRSVKKLGSEVLPDPKDDDFVTYVLDGQQRLTSLYAAHKALKHKRSPRKIDNFGNIYINLNATESEDKVITDVSDLPDKTYIRFTDLVANKGKFVKKLKIFPDDIQEKIAECSDVFNGYLFSVIEVKQKPIDIATEIFTRLNVGGKKLTVFEIMVAKTYDEERKFDLSEKYKEFIKEINDNISGYGIISGDIILQLIAIILEKNCKGKTILNLEKNAFIDSWSDAIDSIKHAIDYLRNAIKVPVSRLLPYPILLVPFAYFFYHDSKGPTEKQAEELENFFWRCSLGERYSASTESRLVQDIKRIDTILNNHSPEYDWEIDTSTKHLIENGWFNAGASFIKAILCIMASQTPKSFKNHKDIEIKNDWLKRSNSKNYHHFFPKHVLKNHPYANNIVNITILDDRTNKEIGKKPPSEYMKMFGAKQNSLNSKLTDTMKSHLIGDLGEFGIWDGKNGDYDTFMQKRAELICEEIKKRIIEK